MVTNGRFLGMVAASLMSAAACPGIRATDSGEFTSVFTVGSCAFSVRYDVVRQPDSSSIIQIGTIRDDSGQRCAVRDVQEILCNAAAAVLRDVTQAMTRNRISVSVGSTASVWRIATPDQPEWTYVDYTACDGKPGSWYLRAKQGHGIRHRRIRMIQYESGIRYLALDGCGA